MTDAPTTPSALIVGATGGIGSALARRLFSHDWRLALCARVPERLAALGNELDIQLSHQLGPRLTVLVKYARFYRKSAAFPNVEKIWAQVEFAR